MIKRTVEISGEGNRLTVSEGSLVVSREGAEVGRVPLEDLGLLVLDAPTTSYTHWVLTEALGAGAAVVLCGRNHHPCGMFLPQENTLQTQRLGWQVGAAAPLKKSLWKQVVQAKIRNQAATLEEGHKTRRLLANLVSQVRSGDPTNVEAQAARPYWQALFGDLRFRRDPEGDAPNNFLNYGYMVLRATVARAICGAGLHPSFGVHHHNRGNAFCLADDLMEPLRPLVDRRARALWDAGQREINGETKRELLGLVVATVEVGGQKGPLGVAVERVTASLVRCYAGEEKKLELPRLWT